MNPLTLYHPSMSDVHELASIDLNLLVAFDALAEVGSVTRAAAQLGVTQSAMSHTLRRLRALFGDPLLVRVGTEMVLTPRASEVRSEVRTALVALQRVVREPTAFDPRTSERRFALASPDLYDWLRAPALVRRLNAVAPRVEVTFRPAAGHRVSELLETGELDVAIVPDAPWAGFSDRSELLRRALLRDGYSCFLWAEHPALTSGLDLAAYLELGHVLVAPTGHGVGFVDQLLADRGLVRRVAVRVASFPLAPRLLVGTDLVLTAPSALAQTLGELPVVAVPTPFPIAAHGIAAMWHRRVDADPGHRWFRGLL